MDVLYVVGCLVPALRDQKISVYNLSPYSTLLSPLHVYYPINQLVSYSYVVLLCFLPLVGEEGERLELSWEGMSSVCQLFSPSYPAQTRSRC